MYYHLHIQKIGKASGSPNKADTTGADTTTTTTTTTAATTIPNNTARNVTTDNSHGIRLTSAFP